MMAYYLGFRTQRAVFGRYSYIEKAEYWALVWGSMIMAITGAFMTWEEWTLRYFPKWVYDVMTAVHYYEAILACLAVIIWHFYFVMFDPEEYPVKWTFLTGHDGRGDLERRPPDEPPPSP
jgi:cytochrome b subunit of formate dehydrogenase